MGLFSKFKNIFKKEPTKIEEETREAYDKGLEKTRKEFVSTLSVLGHKYNKVTDEYYDELENFNHGRYRSKYCHEFYW